MEGLPHDPIISYHGWKVVGVLATSEQPITFAYTVGLTERFRHPEFILVGVAPEAAQACLNIVARHVQSGARYDLVDNEPAVLGRGTVFGGNLRAAIRRVTPANRTQWLRHAAARYNGAFRAIQLVAPDARDVLPWEEDFDPDGRMRRCQLHLW
jgi:hypothetical protein